MATGQLWGSAFAGAGHDVERLSDDHLSGPDVGPSRAPSALIVALLLVVLYAAFAHGADSDPAEARVQIGLSVVAAFAAVAWLWSGTIRVGARSKALAGVALLMAFAAWNGLTVLWSVAPNQTWLELNREISYVLVLVLAVAVGASHRRPLQTVATGYLLVALAVTVYALGQKAVPGLHISGLFDLNQTSTFARLQAPLDYWNALALFVVFAVPIALVIAVDSERPRPIRLASLLAVELMLLVIALTYSRGGIVALVVAVAVSVTFGGAWLRALILLGAAAVATALPLSIALSVHSLSAAKVPLGDRGVAGFEFMGALLVSLLALFAAVHKLLDHEGQFKLSRERTQRMVRPFIAGLGALVVIGVLALALSSRGLEGSISHAWQTFTTPHTTENVNAPNISASSGNRWVWWKEAVGAWSDRPFGGWGTGSFQVLDLLYRANGHISVQDAHSVPLEWLAETGLVGALLAIGGYGLLLAGGLDAVRRKTGAERAFAAALLAGSLAYAVHAFYDWDWDMPGVTFPALLFLGVLAGSGIRGRTGHGSERPASTRGLALAVCTFVVCIYAVSVVLPSLAATKASAAFTRAGATSSRVQLQQAEATAELAARLDPLSDEGLIAASSIAVSLGHRGQARLYLLQAVGRDPSDVLAWEDLASLELRLRDVRATRQALERVVELDPHGIGGPVGTQLMLGLQKLITPPNESATATSTPLPVG